MLRVSAIEYMQGGMTEHERTQLLRDIEQHLGQTGMGAAYFGKRSCGNSELVARLRAGGRVWPETAARVRAFMETHEGTPDSTSQCDRST